MKDNQLIKQIKEAVADMQEQVVFDSVKHVYTKKADGIKLQGVSTVSSIVPKPWLSAWGSKEVVKALGFSDYDDTEKAEKMLAKIKEMDLKQYLALLRYIKGASYRKSSKGMADGTLGHKWIEGWVKASIKNIPAEPIPNGMLRRPCEQFVEWDRKNIDYWILSEAMVASPAQHYAGTMDGLAMMKDGKLAVIDFKFASVISEDAILQTAGYQNCFEMYEIKIDERIIIRLPKTLEKDKYDKKTRTYSRVPNNLEAPIVKSDYEEDRDVFLHCLPLKRWINKIVNNK